MIPIKSAADLKGMRECSRIAARVRDAVVRKVAPGVTTAELSDCAGELIRGYGGESAFLGYGKSADHGGFPGWICVSVNECVVHGVPGPRRVEMGDIVSIDIGVKYGGYVGDTATTVMVGVWDAAAIRLVRTTERALEAGMEQARAGARLSDVSHAIERAAVEAGFSVVREFVGHGIGKKMHEEPQIPNFGKAGRGPVLKAGMTLALEPMINAGQPEVEIQADGWTVLTRDRKLSAHFEHTIAVRDGAAEILTL